MSAVIQTLTVDGVNLSKLAWNFDSFKGMRSLPAVRAASIAVPGRHGDLPSEFEDFEAAEVSLSMWVAGSDINGLIPRDNTSIEKLHTNLDQLFALFGKRYGMLDLRMTLASGNIRQADAVVVAAIAPDVVAGRSATFTVLFKIPLVFWRDVATSDWTQTAVANATTYDVTTMTGGSAPVTDSVVLFTGPVNTPRITDVASGTWVSYNGTLAAGEQVRIECEKFTATKGTGISWAGAGTSVISAISNGGPGSGSNLLALVPAIQAGNPADRRARVTYTGSGLTGASAVAIRGRRAFL